MAVFRADAKWTVEENGMLFFEENGYGRQRARSSTGMLLSRTAIVFASPAGAAIRDRGRRFFLSLSFRSRFVKN